MAPTGITTSPFMRVNALGLLLGLTYIYINYTPHWQLLLRVLRTEQSLKLIADNWQTAIPPTNVDYN